MNGRALSLLLPLLFALAAPGVAAQDAPEADRIYIATYKIAYSDIPAWMEAYRAHSVPILESLVEEGVLADFNIRMHHTGGEYTIREGYIGHEGTDYEAFWDGYLGPYAQEHPEAFERVNRMIQAHEDEIWNLDLVELGEGNAGGDALYLYEAKFQVNFADMERWRAQWDERFLPVARRALAEGRVAGFVIQSHNTGGKYNWKFSWLFDEWDAFDEVEAEFFGAAPLTHPVFGMFSAHRDELWQAVPPPQ